MNDEEKQYRRIQVEFAPGIYSVLSASSGFAFLLSDSWLFSVAIMLVVVGVFYADKPLRSLVKGRVLYSAIAMSLFCMTAIVPVLVLALLDSSLSELVGAVLVPVGGVSIFIFVWRFYTQERLVRHGWVKTEELPPVF